MTMKEHRHVHVVVNAGHGGVDSGAVSPSGIRESDINLQIAEELDLALDTMPWITVSMTRRTDITMPLNDICFFANQMVPALFVSIHCNSWKTPGPSGFEIFTSRGETAADPFATAIFDAVHREFPSHAMRADYYTDGDPDKEAGYRVLVGVVAPAVLVECGFLSNPRDEAFLKNRTNQERMAKAIARGIIHHFVELDAAKEA